VPRSAVEGWAPEPAPAPELPEGHHLCGTCGTAKADTCFPKLVVKGVRQAERNYAECRACRTARRAA
jgi:hypothetical protein